MKTKILREMLPKGYVTYSGKAFDESLREKYNALQEEINAYLLQEKKIPTALLDESHKIFARASY